MDSKQKYHYSFNSFKYVNAWVSDDGLMIVMNEKRALELINSFKKLGELVTFHRLRAIEFQDEIVNYKWMQIERYVWKRMLMGWENVKD